jgi:autotransporter strand-loop-strand O-heptosyltransferase
MLYFWKKKSIEPKISVILPARGRFDELSKNVRILCELMSNPENVEILIRFDNDDQETIKAFKSLPFIKDYNIKVLQGERYGYANMHKYSNEVCQIAKGKIILTYGTDSKMRTKGWDEKILPFIEEDLVILSPTVYISDGKGGLTPVRANWQPLYSKEMYNVLGHVATNTFIDVYLESVGLQSGIHKSVDIELDMLGEQNELNRETYKEFCTEKIRNDIRTDARKIIDYLEKRGKKYVNLFGVYACHFVGNPFVEIKGGPPGKTYLVEFIDGDTKEVVYGDKIGHQGWARCSRRWYTNWIVKVTDPESNEEMFKRVFSLTGSRVLISLDSKSLGDTIAWIPYVKEFKEKHDCHVIVSTFWNDLFRDNYPELEFVKPGAYLDNLQASYTIGCWDNDLFKNKKDWRTIPIQQVATDILGLNYEEIRPIISNTVRKRKIKEKYVTLSEHATAKCKYWNYHGGWQQIVNYINSLGYKAVVISAEKTSLKNIIDRTNNNIWETINTISHSDFFIGVSSGPAWLAWALKVPVIMISGTTERFVEFKNGNARIINEDVCHGCFNDISYTFDRGDWNWCPRYKDFECTRRISPTFVTRTIDKIIDINKGFNP